MPVLAGYLLGIHDLTEYTNPEIIDLKAWFSLIFRSLSSEEIKDGKISGYYTVDKEIKEAKVKRKTPIDLSITNAIVIFRGNGIVFRSSRFGNGLIKNSTLIDPMIDFDVSHSLEILNSTISTATHKFGKYGSFPALSGLQHGWCSSLSANSIKIEGSEFVNSNIELSSRNDIRIESSQFTDSHIHIYFSHKTKIKNTSFINFGSKCDVDIPQLSLRIESTISIDGGNIDSTIENTSFLTNQRHAILLIGNARDIKNSLIKIIESNFSNPDNPDFAPVENKITGTGWMSDDPVDLFDKSEPINLLIENSSHNKNTIFGKNGTAQI